MTRNGLEPAVRLRIAHVVHRFDVGGMENGVVNLINGLPNDFADHCVIALTGSDPAFVKRIRQPNVRIVPLHRPSGQTARIFHRLYRLLRELRPAIFHTRNVGTLETQLVAWLARIPVRIHGEHGWDVSDLGGTNGRALALRRGMRHFVHHQIALSAPTTRYIVDRVGVPPERVSSIYNGVDVTRFAPTPDRATVRATLAPRHLPADAFVVGAVSRLSAVKNLPMLLQAFAMTRSRCPGFAHDARLVLVGDGPERGTLRAQVAQLGLADCCLMTGASDDVPAWLQSLDLLCLPSLVEGISNAVLEAMATGLPVVATDVGGNAELIDSGVTGHLVPSGDTGRLAECLETCFTNRTALAEMGAAGRFRAVTRFSMDKMIDAYYRVYIEQLRRVGMLSEHCKGRAADGSHA